MPRFHPKQFVHLAEKLVAQPDEASLRVHMQAEVSLDALKASHSIRHRAHAMARHIASADSTMPTTHQGPTPRPRPTRHPAGGPALPAPPDPWKFRQLRRIQQRLESGFWRGTHDDQWVQDTEVLLKSPEFQTLSRWYLKRKPFLHPKALADYCRLLSHHMKGCTLTAHVSIDPEDGWLCLWFTVYGLPALKRRGAIHEEHRNFLDALFAEGLHVRHTSGHIGLMVARGPYRPRD